jgi:hypothetical protein
VLKCQDFCLFLHQGRLFIFSVVVGFYKITISVTLLVLFGIIQARLVRVSKLNGALESYSADKCGKRYA